MHHILFFDRNWSTASANAKFLPILSSDAGVLQRGQFEGLDFCSQSRIAFSSKEWPQVFKIAGDVIIAALGRIYLV